MPLWPFWSSQVQQLSRMSGPMVWLCGSLLVWGKALLGMDKHQKVIHEVENGFRLPCPMDAPPQIYNVMLACWQADRHKRPDAGRFWHCSAEYRGEPDDKYSNCLIEPGMDYCDLLKELHQAKDFRKYFLAIIPLILSVFVIALNFMFVVVVCSLIFHNRKGSRKRYAFLVSRSTSTIIAVILFYIVLIAWKLQSFNYFSATIFLFSDHVQVFNHNCLIWTISVGSSIAVGIFGGTLFYPQTAPIQCDFEDCQLPLAVCLVMLFATSYFTVIGSYIGMVMRMRWRCASKVSPTTTNASLPVQSFDSHTPAKIGNSKLPNWSNTAQDRNIKAMNRLAWNLATFTVSKSPLLAISIIALINLAELRTLDWATNHTANISQRKIIFSSRITRKSCSYCLANRYDGGPYNQCANRPSYLRFH
uniref:Serine-threonine/tyrosine-protein kinase catalytic domain-containing protein n=1 Tax=Ditylenchus dipsaci TaxID=166011 RepID=A0A915DQU8_9BILA